MFTGCLPRAEFWRALTFADLNWPVYSRYHSGHSRVLSALSKLAICSSAEMNAIGPVLNVRCWLSMGQSHQFSSGSKSAGSS